MTFRISLLCSVALAVIPSVVQAADGSITITGNQNDIYVATDKVSGSSFDNFTANSNSATFKKDLIGTQNKTLLIKPLIFQAERLVKILSDCIEIKEISIFLERIPLISAGER